MHTPPNQQQPEQWPQQHMHPQVHRARKEPMPVWAIVVLAFAGIVMLGAVASVFDTGEKKPAAKSSTAPSTPSASRPAKSVRTPSAQAAIPEPDADQTAEYLAALAAIDPGLTVREDRAMRRASRVCERIISPPGGTMTLEHYTVEELSGGNATIDEAQARQVIKAVKKWCH